MTFLETMTTDFPVCEFCNQSMLVFDADMDFTISRHHDNDIFISCNGCKNTELNTVQTRNLQDETFFVSWNC